MLRPSVVQSGIAECVDRIEMGSPVDLLRRVKELLSCENLAFYSTVVASLLPLRSFRFNHPRSHLILVLFPQHDVELRPSQSLNFRVKSIELVSELDQRFSPGDVDGAGNCAFPGFAHYLKAWQPVDTALCYNSNIKGGAGD